MKDAPLLSETFGCPIVVHREEMEYIHSPEVKLSPYSARIFEAFENGVKANGMLVEDEQHLSLGSLDIRVMKVPGHSQASICFYVEAETAIFDEMCIRDRSTARIPESRRKAFRDGLCASLPTKPTMECME